MLPISGVPKFYRWISERYPCLSQVVKDYQVRMVGCYGNELGVDACYFCVLQFLEWHIKVLAETGSTFLCGVSSILDSPSSLPLSYVFKPFSSPAFIPFRSQSLTTSTWI